MGPGAGMVLGAGINAGLGLFSSWLTNRAIEKARKEQAATASRIGQAALDTSEQNAQDIAAVGTVGETKINEAAQRAAEKFGISVDEANELLRSLYGDSMAALEPYQATGRNAIQTLNAATGPGGDFNRTFTGADLENEPGYQFRLQEGAKALERSAAARGTLLGGRGLKEMERYSQGYASNEFQNAFDRFRTDRADRFGMLYNLSGLGMRATETGIGAGETYGGRVAGNLMTGAKYAGDVDINAADAANRLKLATVGQAGDYRMRGLGIWGDVSTGAANTNAAATLASNNAWTQGLSGIGNAAWDLSYLNAQPKKPTGYGHYDPDTGQWIPGV